MWCVRGPLAPPLCQLTPPPGLFPIPGITTGVAVVASLLWSFVASSPAPNHVVVPVVNLLFTVPDVLLVRRMPRSVRSFHPPDTQPSPPCHRP